MVGYFQSCQQNSQDQQHPQEPQEQQQKPEDQKDQGIKFLGSTNERINKVKLVSLNVDVRLNF